VRPDRVDTRRRFAARLASGLATRSGRRYRLSMESLSLRRLIVFIGVPHGRGFKFE
jgi:hypothetical protein